MKRGPLIAALVGGGLVLLMVVGLILPKAAQVRGKQQEVAKAAATEVELRGQLSALQEDALQAGAARERLLSLESQVPPTADLPGLIRLVNTAAADSSVDFMSIAPGAPAASATGGLTSIPASITITGSYFSLDQFLFRLETLQRVSRVLSIALTSGAEAGQLQLVMAAEFYTTDQSAGPGSLPGPSDVPIPNLSDLAGAPAVTPAPTVAPTESPA